MYAVSSGGPCGWATYHGLCMVGPSHISNYLGLWASRCPESLLLASSAQGAVRRQLQDLSSPPPCVCFCFSAIQVLRSVAMRVKWRRSTSNRDAWKQALEYVRFQKQNRPRKLQPFQGAITIVMRYISKMPGTGSVERVFSLQELVEAKQRKKHFKDASLFALLKVCQDSSPFYVNYWTHIGLTL